MVTRSSLAAEFHYVSVHLIDFQPMLTETRLALSPGTFPSFSESLGQGY